MTTLNELLSKDEQSAAVAAIPLKESIIPKLRKDKEDRDRRAAADADAGRNERKDEMLFGKSCDPPLQRLQQRFLNQARKCMQYCCSCSVNLLLPGGCFVTLSAHAL